jgi:hypothetical protein
MVFKRTGVSGDPVNAKWHEPKGKRFETIRIAPIGAQRPMREWWVCERPEFYEDAIANLRYLEMVANRTGGKEQKLLRAELQYEALPRKNK